jgi:hypothetical protein
MSTCCSDRLRGRILWSLVPPAEPGATLFDAPSRVARDRVEVSLEVARNSCALLATLRPSTASTERPCPITFIESALRRLQPGQAIASSRKADARRRVEQSCPRLGRGDKVARYAAAQAVATSNSEVSFQRDFRVVNGRPCTHTARYTFTSFSRRGIGVHSSIATFVLASMHTSLALHGTWDSWM